MASVSYTYPAKLHEAKEALAALSEVIERTVTARVSPPDYSRIKADLIEQIRREPGLDAAIRERLAGRIELTAVMPPSRYIREVVTSTEELWPILSLLAADAAWNVEDAEPNVVVVSPGLLLSEIRGKSNRPYLDFVVSHELAHSIGPAAFPGLYAPLIHCLKNRYKEDFNGWDEVLADYWAAETMKRSGAGLNDLSRSVEILCDTSGEAGSIIGRMVASNHPSGRYRIDNILGGDSCRISSGGD